MPPDILERVGARTAIVLLAGGLFMFLLVLYFRLRPVASGKAHSIGIEEIRQRLDNAKTHYQGEDAEAFDKAIGTFVASLKAQYGEEVPVVDAYRHIREFPFPLSETASAPQKTNPPPGGDGEKTPDGVSLESTPDGFLLRASTRSLVGGVMWAGFVGALVAIPFVLWGDLIRGVWTDEGWSRWGTIAFLAAWAGGVLCVAAMGAVGLFGEIRILKAGDSGEIFTGIGRAGWTHRLRWSEFYGAGDS
jgi:hypothetical protein